MAKNTKKTKERSLSPAASSARALAKAVKMAAREKKEKSKAAAEATVAPKKHQTVFKRAEELLLVRLVLDHKDIIESKRTDDQTTTAKNECWETICGLFNAQLINVVSVHASVCCVKHFISFYFLFR